MLTGDYTTNKGKMNYEEFFKDHKNQQPEFNQFKENSKLSSDAINLLSKLLIKIP